MEQVVPTDEPKTTKKTPAPKNEKKGAAGVLEDITDNRPREINFTKNFQEEGVPATRVGEDLARFFEGFLLNVDIYQVNRETQEESLKESYSLDLTPLLFQTKQHGQVSFNFDKLKTLEMLYLNVTVFFDQPMLSTFLRNKLNPLQVELVACKDIPYKTEP